MLRPHALGQLRALRRGAGVDGLRSSARAAAAAAAAAVPARRFSMIAAAAGGCAAHGLGSSGGGAAMMMAAAALARRPAAAAALRPVNMLATRREHNSCAIPKDEIDAKPAVDAAAAKAGAAGGAEASAASAAAGVAAAGAAGERRAGGGGAGGAVAPAAKPLTVRRGLKLFAELAKDRLAMLVTLTTMCGYALAPGASDTQALLVTTVGTYLCVAAANTLNQLAEVPFDAQMARTRARPLVRGAVSPAAARAVAAASAAAGVGLLAGLVNPLTAALGAGNIALYAYVYTPLKRAHIANTWVGAVVGAIPPMMGWTAATGSLALPENAGAYLLGFLLYAWQFPHFNALAHNLRHDYAAAGYKMMAASHPQLNARVALRYALALVPLPAAAVAAGLTTPWFALSATAVNGALALYAFRFWRHADAKSARHLFLCSLLHLPVILTALLVHKTDDADAVMAAPVLARVARAGSTAEDEDDDDSKVQIRTPAALLAAWERVWNAAMQQLRW